MKARPSLIVTFILQLMRLSIFPPLDFGGGYKKRGVVNTLMNESRLDARTMADSNEDCPKR
jgi:hypothetical protein